MRAIEYHGCDARDASKNERSIVKPITTKCLWDRSLDLGLVFFISFCFCSAAQAQQSGKFFRVGILEANSATSASQRLEGLREGLRELGYVEHQTLALEIRYADGELDRIPGLAAELVSLKLDLLVVSSTPGAIAAPAAAIDRVQGPAWIDRAGKEMPATPGTELIVTEQDRAKYERLLDSGTAVFAKMPGFDESFRAGR